MTNAPGAMWERVGTDALLIAASSGFGYLLALEYERGYCFFFGIPELLIAPTVPVIAAAISVVLVIASGGMLLPMIPVLTFSQVRVNRRFTLSFAIACGLLMTLTLMAGIVGWIAYTGVLAIYLAVVVLLTAFAVARYRGRGDPTALTIKLMTTMLVILGLLVLAPLAGHYRAARTKIFYTLSSQRDVAVIRNYGDVLVGVRIDRAQRRLVSEVLAIRPENGELTTIYREVIGPLHGYERTSRLNQ